MVFSEDPLLCQLVIVHSYSGRVGKGSEMVEQHQKRSVAIFQTPQLQGLFFFGGREYFVLCLKGFFFDFEGVLEQVLVDVVDVVGVVLGKGHEEGVDCVCLVRVHEFLIVIFQVVLQVRMKMIFSWGF